MIEIVGLLLESSPPHFFSIFKINFMVFLLHSHLFCLSIKLLEKKTQIQNLIYRCLLLRLKKKWWIFTKILTKIQNIWWRFTKDKAEIEDPWLWFYEERKYGKYFYLFMMNQIKLTKGFNIKHPIWHVEAVLSSSMNVFLTPFRFKS